MVRIRKRLRIPAVWGALGLTMLGLLLWPAEAAEAARTGLRLCYQTVVPALFPFFALSSMAVEFGLAAWLGRRCERLMRPVFGLSGACSAALMLGLVGGYPVGARCAASLYEKGLITRPEAERLLGFCNNCGPAFLVGVAGVGVFGSGTLGMVLWLVHIAAALLTGLLLRAAARRRPVPAHGERPVPADKKEPLRLAAAFSETVKSAFFSTLSVCGYVVFFAVLTRLLEVSGILTALATGLALLLQPLGIGRTMTKALLTGLLEVTGGVTALGGGAPADLRLCLCALLLGWGGVSVHCQAMSFLGPAGLSGRNYVLGKAMQGLLSFLLMLLVTRLTAGDRLLPVFAAAGGSGLGTGVCLCIGGAVGLIWLAAVALCTRRRER